jgi:hypothetical protein
LLAAPAVRAQFSTSTVKAIDVYRSEQIDGAELQAALGPLLTSYARLRYEGRKNREKEMGVLKAQIETQARKLGDIAFLELYVGDYVTSADRKIYFTFDTVDKKDAAARMPFRAVPAGHYEDPGGLLAAWQQYDQKGLELLAQGVIEGTEHVQCPAYYCRWGSSAPELAAAQQKLAQGAEGQKKSLAVLIKDDADPARRAAALFAYSYIQDGAEVAKAALDSLQDPSVDVRSAGLQILSDIAVYHKSVKLDISRIIDALDYPTVSDRSKALGMLVALADAPDYRSIMLTKAAPKLLPLLRLEQPSNHDLAFTVLSVLSQASFDSHDYEGWAKWVDDHASGKAQLEAPKKKRWW